MILSFINIRKVPGEVLKTEGEWKIMFDPSIAMERALSVSNNLSSPCSLSPFTVVHLRFCLQPEAVPDRENQHHSPEKHL